MSNKVIKVCDNENFWAAMLYVSSLVVIFPLSNIIIPLVLWMLKAKESDLIEFHGKNVLNFQYIARQKNIKYCYKFIK